MYDDYDRRYVKTLVVKGMEFVGRTIKKEFKGLGAFTGVINTYDPSSGLFEILYEDGDSEELELSVIVSLVKEMGMTVDDQAGYGEAANMSARVGIMPPKRRKVEICGKAGENFASLMTDSCLKDVRVNGDLKASDDRLNLNDDAPDLDGGLDLNVGLNLNDGFNFNVNPEQHTKKSVCIDLNVDANGECEESMKEVDLRPHAKREHCFDLNLGLDEDAKTLPVDFEKEWKEDNELDVVGQTQNQERDRGVKEAQAESDSKSGEEVCFDASVKTHFEAIGNGEENAEAEMCSDVEQKQTGVRDGLEGGNPPGVINPDDIMTLEDQLKVDGLSEVPTPPVDGQGNSGSACKKRNIKRRRKLSDKANSSIETPSRRRSQRLAIGDSSVGLVENVHKESGVCGAVEGGDTPGDVGVTDFLSSEGHPMEGPLVNDTPLDHVYQGNSGSMRRGRKRRKGMELLDNGSSATETIFRRSSRRLAAALSADNEAQSSAALGTVHEETFTASNCKEFEEYSGLPPKLQLPPSSENLDLNGIPILGLFSVYACLRSFSTLLFLSPFNLEDFVASLKCNNSNVLFDLIHVSLLQTLRKHLEFLSDENVLSASNCLRSLNWDFLDSITWPIFMADYLLTHGSALKTGFDLPKLKLFESDYYKQPAAVKIEILCCLCDDVIEVEAIRSELNKRTLATELNMDIEQNMMIETFKRKRTSMDVSGASCMTEEVVDETADWNSDECCLCKMDGNLICCDGCPAAYHLKCVGVANNLLPEGDWYCPECAIDKDNPWLKLGKSLRGAELLGVDPYGRLYYSSSGYLLVSDSCDTESSYHYYHRNDLTAVIERLKSSDPVYKPILGAILKQLNTPINSDETKSDIDSHNPAVYSELAKEQIYSSSVLQLSAARSDSCRRDENLDERKPEEIFIATQCSGSMECEASALVSNNLATMSNSMKIENLLTSSEGSVETSQTPGMQNLPISGSEGLKRSLRILSDSKTQEKIPSGRDVSLTSAILNGELEKNIQSAECGHMSPVTKIRLGERLLGQSGFGYMNHYRFAHTASIVAEELTQKSKDKINENSIKSVEDVISAQLKAISKKSTKFSWPINQDLGAAARKEKCGWCFACRAPDNDYDSSDCFFNLNGSDPQGFVNELAGLRLKWNKKGHLIDVMCYILCMEDRLRGLLLGPWLNPHYTNVWRKSVMKASDVASLKYFLLILEINLNRLALKPEWIKHVDSVSTMGSASHIVTSSSRVSSKPGVGKKRARCSDVEPKPSSNAASGMSLLWWRGGRLSRELFSWKVLPHALASKAARQAGSTKIPGLLYPDSSDFTKRSKFVIWQAAVEASRSVEQLALQVRELDANIRWEDIENTHLLSKMDQYRKSVRSFKKVIIRRKCTEGTVVKYLLDFGKRRFIPDIVITHGSIVEESSSGRKKYWLEEAHVPLHLLKAFEERRIARKSNKMNPGKLHGSGLLTKKTPKRRGFSYLFAKAERSEYYQCGHCSKDVLIREAVSCQYCKGFFHKRHVKKSAGAIAAEGMYHCYKCQGGNSVKVETKKGKKTVSQKNKNSFVGSRVLRSKLQKKSCGVVKPAQKQKNNKKNNVVLPLRRSPRKLKCVSLQTKKVGRRKKGKVRGKQIKPRKSLPKKPKKCSCQKKRTQVYHSYWLNGILLSRKPNDERVILFKSKNLVAPLEPSIAFVGHPKCSLCCEQDFTSTLSYLGCEICGDWFHGDAFGLSMENIDSVIGFRCHRCRDRTSPTCPHLHRKTGDEAELGELNTKARIQSIEQVSEVIAAPPTEVLEFAEPECDVDEGLKNPSSGDQSSHGDQEHGAISFPISAQSNVENVKLLKSEEQRRESVESSKDDNDDSLAKNTAVAIENDFNKAG